MKLNNVCCIGGDISGKALCSVIAYKCPEVRVTILDDEKNVPKWYSNTPPFYEPELNQIVKKCRHRNLFFSSFYEASIREADMIFLSVEVPVKNITGRKLMLIDFKELERVTKLIALYSESDKIMIEKSNVPAKAVEKICSILQSTCATNYRYHILSLPYFLMQHSSVGEILNPERIAIGCFSNPSEKAAAESLSEVFERWVPRKNIVILSHRSVELYKIVSNTLLAQIECSINSIMSVCEETGANFSEVLNILNKYSGLGLEYTKPSIGLEMFQEDISNLIFTCELQNMDEAAEYWRAILDLNNLFVERFIEKISLVVGSVQNENITVWGFSLKGSTQGFSSSTVKVCKWLIKENSNLRIFDPEGDPDQILKVLELDKVDKKKRNLQIFDDIYLSLNNSSAVIICTKRKEFFKVDSLEKLMKRALVIDGHQLFDENDLSKVGVKYYTVGSKITKDAKSEV